MGDRRALATVGVISSLAVLSCALFYLRKQQQERRKQKNHLFSSGHGGTYRDKKPQERFECVLADNSRTPFVHLVIEENGNGSSHPYEKRIRELLEHPPLKYLFMQPGCEEPPGMEGQCEWIETKEELQALVQVLSDETEIAVDTEQHNFHSFRGFTSLVQISTRNTDYLVDSIALHDSMSILGPVFANPAICKVFHGADNDILWLQRDFHIYVVNMFDTAKACAVLGKQQKSLSSLLQLYCSVTTNKAFQRADWRLRPLPKDMLQYARTDAHYLLYIAHRLCSELVQNISDEKMQDSGTDVEEKDVGGVLERALYLSNLNCLNLFEKEGASASPANTATTLVSRYFSNNGSLPPSQLHDSFSKLVTGLCEWRDSLARVENESLGSILSDTALMALAISGPSTPEHIYATIAESNASPQVQEAVTGSKIPHFASPSPIVQKYIDDLHQVIQNSSDGDLDESVLQKGTLKSSLNWLAKKAISMFKLSGSVGVDYRHQFELLVNRSEHKTPKRQKLGTAEKSRIQFVKKFSCKAPVYHNCRIYADNGRLLCFCDRKKLEWYVKRGLAEFVEEEPPSVRLLFEPKGRPEYEGNDFYVQSKSNQCVGCGESSHYLRYRIIPSCYRQHFPEHLKSHRSHDIVLLCVDCHEIAHKAAEKHKRQIAKEYGVPLFATVTGDGLDGRQNKEVVSNDGEGGVSPLMLKNAAMALLRHGSKIPSQRRVELEKVVRTYYGRDNLSESDLHAVLLLSMGPQEHRRLFKKGVYKGDGAPAGSQEVSRQDEIGKECPRNQPDTSVSLQGLNPSSLATSEQATGKTVPTGHNEVAHFDLQDGESYLDERDEDMLAQNTLEENDNEGRPMGSVPWKRRYPRHKNRRNESLLGHAVHGRRVVEILMEQEGDEEILKFCQRWRRVFVDALQPAFLPLGWEISHRQEDLLTVAYLVIGTARQRCQLVVETYSFKIQEVVFGLLDIFEDFMRSSHDRSFALDLFTVGGVSLEISAFSRLNKKWSRLLEPDTRQWWRLRKLGILLPKGDNHTWMCLGGTRKFVPHWSPAMDDGKNG